jgi:hypothetical protein
MAPHSSLRASDADRDAVADQLRHAAVEGRLEHDELEERLHAALRARTYGDLKRLLVDLPSRPVALERRMVGASPVPRIAFAVAVRVAVTLALVAVVVTVAALLTAWWIIWVVVWFGLRGRRSAIARLGPRPPWGPAPPRCSRARIAR